MEKGLLVSSGIKTYGNDRLSKAIPEKLCASKHPGGCPKVIVKSMGFDLPKMTSSVLGLKDFSTGITTGSFLQEF